MVNGKYAGAMAQFDLSIVEDLSGGADDNFSDISDNVSVRSDADNRVTNFPASMPGIIFAL